MLQFLTPSFLPAHVLRPAAPRHIGFLNANRRYLAIGAIAASGLLTSIPSFPAAAEVVNEEAVPLETPQTLTVASYVPVSVVARDTFGISSYSVVQWPVAVGASISSYWGYRDCAGCTTVHSGIDFVPGEGTPVQAIADGVVTEAGYAADYGVHVIIQHVINGETVSSLYAHMQEGSMNLTVGQSVTRGTQLGTVGQTGEATGPHLHFTIIIGGQYDYVNPYPWLLEHVNI